MQGRRQPNQLGLTTSPFPSLLTSDTVDKADYTPHLEMYEFNRDDSVHILLVGLLNVLKQNQYFVIGDLLYSICHDGKP